MIAMRRTHIDSHLIGPCRDSESILDLQIIVESAVSLSLLPRSDSPHHAQSQR